MHSHEQQGTGYDPGASGHELAGRESAPPRCGSYPFAYIAEDFGVPYGVVIRASECDGFISKLSPEDCDTVLACISSAARISHFTCAIRKALGKRDDPKE